MAVQYYSVVKPVENGNQSGSTKNGREIKFLVSPSYGGEDAAIDCGTKPWIGKIRITSLNSNAMNKKLVKWQVGLFSLALV